MYDFVSTALYFVLDTPKPTPDSTIGVKLTRVGDSVYILSIAQDSLFAGSDLKEGYRVVFVNDKPCQGLTAKEARKFVIEAVGKVTIFAEDTESTTGTSM